MNPTDEAAVEAMARYVRIGCDASDMHLRCDYPACGCKHVPIAVKAALAALLASPPPAVRRAVLLRVIDRVRKRGEAQVPAGAALPQEAVKRLEWLLAELAEESDERTENP